MNTYYNVKKELNVRLYCTWLRKDAVPRLVSLYINGTLTQSISNISSLQALKTIDRVGFVITIDKSLLPMPGNVNIIQFKSKLHSIEFFFQI